MKSRNKTKSIRNTKDPFVFVSIGQTNEELKKLYDMKTNLEYKIMELDEKIHMKVKRAMEAGFMPIDNNADEIFFDGSICWPKFERVPNTKPYAKRSCRRIK